MKLPQLPENQRWTVSKEMGTFIIVRLQERRKFLWWHYWETIAKSSEYISTGEYGVRLCVDHILNRDYYERLRAANERRKAEERSRIPWGKHQGGEQ